VAITYVISYAENVLTILVTILAVALYAKEVHKTNLKSRLRRKILAIIVNPIVSFATAIMITDVLTSVTNVIPITIMEELSAKEVLKRSMMTVLQLRLKKNSLAITIVKLIATFAIAILITTVLTNVPNVSTITIMEIIVASVTVKIVDVITNAPSALLITTMEILLAAILAIVVITCVITSVTNVLTTTTTMEILLTATLAFAVIALVITSVTNVIIMVTI